MQLCLCFDNFPKKSCEFSARSFFNYMFELFKEWKHLHTTTVISNLTAIILWKVLLASLASQCAWPASSVKTIVGSTVALSRCCCINCGTCSLLLTPAIGLIINKAFLFNYFYFPASKVTLFSAFVKLFYFCQLKVDWFDKAA